MKIVDLKFWLLSISSFVMCIGYSQSQLSKAIEKTIPAVFLIQTFDEDNNKLAIGSGFFIDSVGTGVTNYHVLAGATYATITLQDETVFPIESIIGQDSIKDLILFKVPPPETKTFNWLKVLNEIPQLGEDVFTIGNPEGLSFSISNGIISSIRKDEMGEILQTTAPISPGSSGSPLLNMKGEVIGVVSFFIKNGQNLNFAISSKYVSQILKSDGKKSFPPVSIYDKQRNSINESMFKRFNWNTTQSQVRINEKSKLFSDDVDYESKQPQLQYITTLAGKPVLLEYDFNGGFLSEISYVATFGFKENGFYIWYASLEKILDFFINTNAELIGQLGEHCGCAYYGYYYGYNELNLKKEVLHYSGRNCIERGEMTKYKIIAIADSAFEFDKNYCVRNNLFYDEISEGLTYHVLWENNDNHYELRVNYMPEENISRKYLPNSEANCKLTITPNRKDIICEDK